MIRIATERDVPEILDIYAPYILTTTCSFEYNVPTETEFLQRFRAITAQFPWLVWEEDGKILGYAYGSAPFERAAYRWCSESSIYLRPEARGRGIGSRLCACLEKSSPCRASAGSTPSSLRKMMPPLNSTGRRATGSAEIFRIVDINSAAGWGSPGWKKS